MIAPGRVRGLAGGTYAYDAGRHRADAPRRERPSEASLFDPVNQDVFAQAAFVLFLVSRQAEGRHGAMLEAGRRAQLLEAEAPGQRVGLTQIGGLRFDAVRGLLGLEEEAELLHTLLGGRLAAEQTGLAAYLAEAAEYHSLVDGLGGAAAAPAAAARTEPAVLAGIREFLAGRLPAYMVPAHLLEIDALPLSANGKVDRKALPEPAALLQGKAAEGAAHMAPQNDLERVIALVVAQALGLPQVGIHDNFFDLGASSVHVVRFNNALREALGREIPMVDMFNHPSVALLARHLSPPGEAPAAPAAERGDKLREGKDWRKQRLQKRQAAKG